MVHGTFARGASWTRSEGVLAAALEAELGPGVEIRTFCWSGLNSHAARLRAGDRLGRRLEAEISRQPGRWHALVGHSHGGNVALYGLNRVRRRDRVGAVVCLSTPFWRLRPRTVLLALQPAFAEVMGVIGAAATLCCLLALFGLAELAVLGPASAPAWVWLRDLVGDFGVALPGPRALWAGSFPVALLTVAGSYLGRLEVFERAQRQIALRLRYPDLGRTRVLAWRTSLDEALLWLRGVGLVEALILGAAFLPALAAGVWVGLTISVRSSNLLVAVLGCVASALGAVALAHLSFLAGAALSWFVSGLPWGVGQELAAVLTVHTRPATRPPGVRHVQELIVPRPPRRSGWGLRHSLLHSDPEVARRIARAIGRSMRSEPVDGGPRGPLPPGSSGVGGRAAMKRRRPARKASRAAFEAELPGARVDALASLERWCRGRGAVEVVATGDGLRATLDPVRWFSFGPRSRIVVEVSLLRLGEGSCLFSVEGRLGGEFDRWSGGVVIGSFLAAVCAILGFGWIGIGLRVESSEQMLLLLLLPSLVLALPGLFFSVVRNLTRAAIARLEDDLLNWAAWTGWKPDGAAPAEPAAR